MHRTVILFLATFTLMAVQPGQCAGQGSDTTARFHPTKWSLSWMPLHLMNSPNAKRVGDAFPLTRARRIDTGLLHLELQRRLDRHFLLGIRVDMAAQQVSGYQMDTLISESFFIFGSTYTYNGDMVGIEQRMVLIGPQFAYEPALGADRKWFDTRLRFHGTLQYMALREHHNINPDRNLTFSYDIVSASLGMDPYETGKGPEYPFPQIRVASHTRHGIALQLGVRALLLMGQHVSITVFDLSGLLATPLEMPSTTAPAANGREARIDAHKVVQSRLLIACGVAVHL